MDGIKNLINNIASGSFNRIINVPTSTLLENDCNYCQGKGFVWAAQLAMTLDGVAVRAKDTHKPCPYCR